VRYLALLPALLLAVPAQAALRLPAPPAEGQHVVDLADLITPRHEEEIQALGAKLQEELHVHLVVVAIDSMAEFGGARMPIEDFAARLFQAWDIGQPARYRHAQSMGMLLLVSRLDQRARIELGAGWEHSKNAESLKIMNLLLPEFQKERFSSGLARGALALDSMARELELPRPPLTSEQWLTLAGAGALLLWTVISLVRSGSEGWAWGFWSFIFGMLWWFLQLTLSLLLVDAQHDRRRRRARRLFGFSGSTSRPSSSFSGSSWSSRGGSSGSRAGSSSGRGAGGGATGSW
jgi:uncharacterized protein